MLVIFKDGTKKDLIPQVAEHVIKNGSAYLEGSEQEIVKKKEIKTNKKNLKK